MPKAKKFYGKRFSCEETFRDVSGIEIRPAEGKTVPSSDWMVPVDGSKKPVEVKLPRVGACFQPGSATSPQTGE